MTYLENKFKDAGEFHYGRAFVETLDGKTYCINKKGKVLFECDGKGEYGCMPKVNEFRQTIIQSKHGDSVKAKIIDINGNNVIPCEYKDLMFGIYDGLLAAEEYGQGLYNKMGYINIKNETVIPFIYEFYSQPFENGVAVVNVDCEYVKYIKTNGEDLWLDENQNTITKISSVFGSKVVEPIDKAKKRWGLCQ